MMENKTKGRRSSSRRIMRSPFCIPMNKGNSACARKTNLPLLNRLRDAVLRLIMLSALSKAAAAAARTQGRKSNAQHKSTTCLYQYYPHHYHEPHRSEALADCIEFIKKSATTADGEIYAAAKDDGSGRVCCDAAAEVVLPVPVTM